MNITSDSIAMDFCQSWLTICRLAETLDEVDDMVRGFKLTRGLSAWCTSVINMDLRDNVNKNEYNNMVTLDIVPAFGMAKALPKRLTKRIRPTELMAGSSTLVLEVVAGNHIWNRLHRLDAVSYTHLTLPTIYSV